MSNVVDPAPSILSKAFDLLRAFNTRERVMSFSELVRASGLPKSTVHRLLARLVELDVIEHHRSGYKIGIQLFKLGAITPAASMRDVAMPFLAGLHRQFGLTVHLAVLRQFNIVYLERLSRRNAPSSLSGVGSILPANCTAIGKALLAYEDLDDLEVFLPNPMPMMTPESTTDVGTLLAQLREIQGGVLARERNEAQRGLACMASPIVVQGFAVGAVSVSYRADARLDPEVETALRDTTARISREVRAGLAEGREAWLPYEA
ncbi:IclR family transcriptional regulator [Streptomyces sp. GbtcB7]|uniref:IclR family transcriptional regulator n=1 Tax=Streptomyces sp. GbtcB7 TaxID=2824752 RepID=UPI001C307188|nr:IclR family transcriptional regulator [Streptomyces sp. GbtcB7]